MFCPQCGAQNPDNATFCGSCGAPVNAPAAQQPRVQVQGSQPAPQPAAAPQGAHAAGAPFNRSAYGSGTGVPSAPGGKGLLGNRTVLIALIAVAAIVIIAIIVGALTCSRGASANLDAYITDDPEKVAGSLENMSNVKTAYGWTAYTANDEMKDVFKDANEAFFEDSKKDANKLTEDIQRLNPWAVALFEEDDDDRFSNIKLKDIQKKSDPSRAIYISYRVLDNPTCEDIAKIVGEVASYDTMLIGGDPDKNSMYSSSAFQGFGGTKETVIHVSVRELDGTYEITVENTNLKEVDGDAIEDMRDNFEDDFDDYDFDTSFEKK